MRESAFSYQCRGCGRCCHHKRIPLAPYDILRLSRHLGLGTGEFLHRYTERDGPWLRVTDDGGCVFLDGGRCSVHADRPFACRVYPLGRWVTAQGMETFHELPAHPQSAGTYGRDGTVSQFLERQGAFDFMAAADRYQALFYRLFEVLHQKLPGHPDVAAAVPAALLDCASEAGDPAFMEWLDADGIVERYCGRRGLAVPDTIDAVMQLHIEAMDDWLQTSTGDAS